MQNSAWKKVYLKEGYAGLSEYSISMFRVLSRKYRGEITQFLTELKKSLGKMGITELDQAIADGLMLSEKISSYYARLSGDRVPPLKKDELQNLDDSMIRVTAIISELQAAREQDSVLSKRIKALEEKSGVDVKSLKSRHAAAIGITAKTDVDSGKGSWLRKSGEFLEERRGWKQALLANAFGGFAPLVEAGLQGIGKLAQKRADKKERARLKAEMSERYSALQDLGSLPEGVGEGIAEFQSRKTFDQMFNKGTRRDRQSSTKRSGQKWRDDPVFDVKDRGRSARGRSELRGFDLSIENGMFLFYDNRAMKAQWTRRVLAALEGKQPKDRAKTDTSSVLPVVAKAAIPFIVSAVLAAGGGILLAWLHDKFVKARKSNAKLSAAEAMQKFGGLSKEEADLRAATPEIRAVDDLGFIKRSVGSAEKAKDIMQWSPTAAISKGVANILQLPEVKARIMTDTGPNLLPRDARKQMEELSTPVVERDAGMAAAVREQTEILQKAFQDIAKVRQPAVVSVGGRSPHHSEDSTLEYLQIVPTGPRGDS